MGNQKIFTESTLKLKTKVLLFSGVSLFIGLTKALPTKLSLIGLDFEHTPKILGWFLFVMTMVLFINFVLMLFLDLRKYHKKNIIKSKSKNLTGDTIGFTLEDIDEEYKRQEFLYGEMTDDDRRGTISDELEDIRKKIKALEEEFDIKQLSMHYKVELLFNGALPINLAIGGMIYLFCFLVQ